MADHINYEQEQDRRAWWINTTGGAAHDNMTVQDYFAAKAMGTLIAKVDYEEWADLSKAAYALADAMMKERAK
jgi:hypothetical protein